MLRKKSCIAHLANHVGASVDTTYRDPTEGHKNVLSLEEHNMTTIAPGSPSVSSYSPYASTATLPADIAQLVSNLSPQERQELAAALSELFPGASTTSLLGGSSPSAPGFGYRDLYTGPSASSVSGGAIDSSGSAFSTLISALLTDLLGASPSSMSSSMPSGSGASAGASMPSYSTNGAAGATAAPSSTSGAAGGSPAQQMQYWQSKYTQDWANPATQGQAAQDWQNYLQAAQAWQTGGATGSGATGSGASVPTVSGTSIPTGSGASVPTGSSTSIPSGSTYTASGGSSTSGGGSFNGQYGANISSGAAPVGTPYPGVSASDIVGTGLWLDNTPGLGPVKNLTPVGSQNMSLTLTADQLPPASAGPAWASVRQYLPEFNAAAQKYNVPAGLLIAQSIQETSGGTNAPSTQNSIGTDGKMHYDSGIMQVDDQWFPPGTTFAQMTDPANNIDHGAMVLANYINTQGGIEGALHKYATDPTYATKVLGYWGQISGS